METLFEQQPDLPIVYDALKQLKHSRENIDAVCQHPSVPLGKYTLEYTRELISNIGRE
jgi:hypothetical protein